MSKTSNGGHRKKTISVPRTEVYMNYMTQNQVRYDKAYLNDEEQRTIIAELGDSAVMLLSYLLRVAARKDWDEITDKGCAFHFGWSTRKVQKLRLMLEKAGYFSSERFYANGGKKVIVYYIGKGVVPK